MANIPPSGSLYAQVDRDMRSISQPVSLGFDFIQNQQRTTSTISPPHGHTLGPPTVKYPTPHSNCPEQNPSTSTMVSQFEARSTLQPHPVSNKFQIQISSQLRMLQQKYSSSMILLFPYENSSEHGMATNTAGVGQWKSANYVRLPHNAENTATPQQSGNQQRYMDSVRKWNIVIRETEMLNKFISEIGMDMRQAGNQIHTSVRKYSSKAADFTFNLLNHPKIITILQSAFPIIAKSALEMKCRFPNGIPILRKNEAKTLFLSQGQIRCILANAFLCTFPKRLEVTGQELSEINFFKLFDGGARGDNKPKIEKLLCILNYFRKIGKIEGEGSLLSFERRQLRQENRPDWKNSKERMSMVHVNYKGRIEDAKDMLQIDFANRFVGGGVLGNGAVMEEIRFSVCPELITALLFTEALGPDEVLIITGSQQFSSYSGYADTFTFKGDFNDLPNVEDALGRRHTQIAVMDASYFRANEAERQFEKECVRRELNKSFCAFRPRKGQNHVTPIATGNWGCGAFHGNPELKFIIQWMAASQSGQRALHYYTSGDKEQSERILKMVKYLGRKGVRVGTLNEALKGYYLNEIKSPSYFKSSKTLFQYLEKNFN